MTELAELPGELFVYKFASLATVPFDSLVAIGQSTFWNLAATPDEVSLVAPALVVGDDVPVVGPWIGFRVLGNLDFALTGILAALTLPLAAAGVSVFSVSTYDTDYLLVKSATRSAAIAAWMDAGISCESSQPD
ncbi:MAG: ACT domain-containing protein [Actinomycetota bacterium]|nr:ACT domain-containing protein [Actinomycetota bacterium]MDP2287143.1 ACT domain-containing protein [Actinomycetota bacterium]